MLGGAAEIRTFSPKFKTGTSRGHRPSRRATQYKTAISPERTHMVSARLSLMMFLQFFIWGAWYVTVGNYMAANGLSEVIHWAYTVGPVSALISPFVFGNLADRYVAAERVLGALNMLGGVAMLAAAGVGGRSASLFIALLFIHTLCFFPTPGLANSLVFHHVADTERSFPLIRVFGSLGWIFAGVLVSLVLHADESPLPLYLAGGVSVLAGLYALTLPHTPPKGRVAGVAGWKRRLGLDAFDLLKRRPFLVFVLCELLISVPLSAYYTYAPVFVNAAGVANPGFQMSFGQMSEVAFMFLMPWVLIRLGVKRMIVVGFVAWVVRFLCMALAASSGNYAFILFGILLHGICFDFVYIAGEIFVNRQVTPDIRGQAQGMLVMMRSGIGLMVGAQLSGLMFNAMLQSDLSRMDAWQLFWLVPGGIALMILLLFAAFFFEDDRSKAVHARPAAPA
jgi:nucleoside transporter